MNKKKSVTISDIAKRVGMTTITVSRALSKPDLVKPATLARILEVARELDYVPNAFARGLKRSESLIIGVITASVDNPFYSEMIKAISREAKQHGYTIMLVDTDELEELESKAVDTLLGYRVAGIILSPVSDEPSYQPDYLERLSNGKTPVVLLDRTIHDSPFSRVVLDNLPQRPASRALPVTPDAEPQAPAGADRPRAFAHQRGAPQGPAGSAGRAPRHSGRGAGGRLHADAGVPAYPRLPGRTLGAGCDHGLQPVDHPRRPARLAHAQHRP